MIRHGDKLSTTKVDTVSRSPYLRDRKVICKYELLLNDYGKDLDHTEVYKCKSWGGIDPRTVGHRSLYIL